MAAPGVHELTLGKRKTPIELDSLSREEPFPVTTSKTCNNFVTESNMDTDDKIDMDDNTDTDEKMDEDDKTCNEDNNNYASDINSKPVLPTISVTEDPKLHVGDRSHFEDHHETVDDVVRTSCADDKALLRTDSHVENGFKNIGLLGKLMTTSPQCVESDILLDKLEIILPKHTAGSVLSEGRNSKDVPSVPDALNTNIGGNVVDLCVPNASDIILSVSKVDLCVPEASDIMLPAISDILDNSVTAVKNKAISSFPSNISLTVEKPKVPYKGTMVPCGTLKDYLDSLLTFNRKCMLRKGREVHKIYVDMTKGETFLDDQFAYTEFGKMVLTNGSIRAGRAKNAKQIVVARETLYCSGTAACKRACSGYGICVPGCDKTKMRGHRCSYRIKLTQRLGFVNFWFVEELGSHDQLNGKDCDFKVNSQLAANMASTGNNNAVMDLSSGFKFRAANIPRTPKKLAPKSSTPSPERSHSLLNGGPNQPVSDAGDIQTNYHYVLGLMPNTSPLLEPASETSVSSTENLSTPATSSRQPCAIDMGNLATVAATEPATIQQDVASQLFQANFINYMSTMTNLGIGAALQGAINPLLVNVKQEPQDNLQGQLAISHGQGQLAISKGQGQVTVGYPLVTLPSQIQLSPSQILNSSQSAKSHSPSPLRGQGYRDRSPLVREQGQSSIVQKALEIEAKIKNESSRKMQAQNDVLGQMHNRIMERAKCRKNAQAMRVPQKVEAQALDFSKNSAETDVKHVPHENLNIPNASSLSSSVLTNVPDNGHISSFAFQRFQTLNRVLQSDAFQAAKNQLEKKKLISKNGEEVNEALAPLNLIVKPPKVEDKSVTGDSHEQYFRLAAEWKQGEQLSSEWKQGEQLSSEWTKGEQVSEKDIKGEQVLNGHGDMLDCKTLTETDKLTDNEKELMCRVRQLESHVKQLQNIVMRKDVSTSQPAASSRRKVRRDIDFNKYNTRHVALKVMYLGTGYQGFASQEDSDKTIEHALFEALKKTRLIESRETSNYNRCGRTDKGVSAFCQVVSIDLRSNLLSGAGVKVREGGTAADRPGDKTTEIQYCHILNKNLPPEIRVLAWAPVDPEFSSRFSCKKRTYKYFFPRGNLNIEIMDQAVKRFVGEHDFRNFCKIKVSDGVTNFVRKIVSADIKLLDESDEDGYTMCELTIVGTAFLYHQIRCIVSILFLIGKEKETPEVIDELLNVEKNPKKPQYTMSSDVPLCLYDAEFGEEFEWIHEAYWHEDNIKHIQQLWAEHAVKATMLKRMLEDLDKAKVETECDIAPWSDLSPPVVQQAEWIFQDKWKVYKPLMQRETGITLEEKIENLAKRRKLTTDSDESTAKVGE